MFYAKLEHSILNRKVGSGESRGGAGGEAENKFLVKNLVLTKERFPTVSLGCHYSV